MYTEEMTWGSQGFSQLVHLYHIPSSFWIFLCISGFVTRYMRLQERAVVMVSNPGQHGAR